MTSGRKPIPTGLKLLRGNPGGRLLNKREPRPVVRRPACPSWLSPGAKTVWRETVKDLGIMVTLSASDKHALTALCLAVTRMRENAEIIDRAGSLIRQRGGVVANPACRLERAATELVCKLASEFGLTPSSRTRLVAPPSEHEEEIERRYLS